jgi:hypothetical protein
MLSGCVKRKEYTFIFQSIEKRKVMKLVKGTSLLTTEEMYNRNQYESKEYIQQNGKNIVISNFKNTTFQIY